MGIIRFGLVGGGWRAEFYLRIAKALPERFAIAAMYVRNKDKAEELKRIWGVEVYTSQELFLAAGGYSFAVICLNREVSKESMIRLAAEGFPSWPRRLLRRIWNSLFSYGMRWTVQLSSRLQSSICSSRCTQPESGWPARDTSGGSVRRRYRWPMAITGSA